MDKTTEQTELDFPQSDSRPGSYFPQGPSQSDIWDMFDRIAPRYDLLNRILSFGTDVGWRRRMAGLLNDSEQQIILDLATGTADQVISLFTNSKKVSRVIGLDMSERMLEIGRLKIREKGLAHAVELRVGDATSIEEKDGAFDAVTMSFGIRNVVDAPKALREMNRVLRPGGRVLILEFSLPERPLLRRVYLIYLRSLVPLAGKLFSPDGCAYRYLDETVEGFPQGEEFCDQLTAARFASVSAIPLTFGVATIYEGTKPQRQ